MSNKKLVSVLHVMPGNEDYTLEDIQPTHQAVNQLLGKGSIFVEIADGVGFFAINMKVGEEIPQENFLISKDAEITEEIYGAVVFSRLENGSVLKGLTDDEMVVIANNLLQMQNGSRMLFLDVIAEQLEALQV